MAAGAIGFQRLERGERNRIGWDRNIAGFHLLGRGSALRIGLSRFSGRLGVLVSLIVLGGGSLLLLFLFRRRRAGVLAGLGTRLTLIVAGFRGRRRIRGVAWSRAGIARA
jgi:hypothetical protein